jgi:O-glycosyl hydrolase
VPGGAVRLLALGLFAGFLQACAAGSPTGPTPGGQDEEEEPPVAADVVIQIDAGTTHQALEGFGATTHSLVYADGTQDNVPSALRGPSLQAAYGEVGLTTGNLVVGGLEPSNDNDDPFDLDPDAFVTWRSAVMKEKVVDPASALGLDDPYPGFVISVRRGSPWLGDIRSVDYQRYLDEAAEQVLAGLLDWRQRYGTLPRYAQLLNEPLRGNRSLDGGSIQEVVDLVARAGRRLEDEGLGSVRFVVPGGETEEISLDMARAILEDPEAERHVGAIAYHPYPYGSTYASAANILATSGSGSPDAGEVTVRRELAALGRAHGVPVWMTEVSNGNVDPRSMDHVRARAIHIHDEMVYADAAAYFGMHAFWDSRSQRDHFGNDRLTDAEDSIVLIDNEAGEVTITGMGYAIGHYARWLRRGALRTDASSSDPRVLVTAFRDDARRSLTAVLINNGLEDVVVEVRTDGVALSGDVEGELSVGQERWSPLEAIEPTASDRFFVTLPTESVTTVSVRF